MTITDGKVRAQRTWGDSPTGTTAAEGAKPGTRDFFSRALHFRSTYEQPWLPKVVPFHEMRGKRVLEIGFGPGYDALTFMQSGADYSGVDITPENVERTKAHLGFYGFKPNVQQGDAEALPFPDNSFDAVYSNGVLHHVPSIEKAFAEAARVMKPGGSFHVILYNRRSLFYAWTVFYWLYKGRPGSLAEARSRIEHNTVGELPIVNVYSKREVRDLLAGAALRCTRLSVRKLTHDEIEAILPAPRLVRLIPRAWLDRLGRLFGWYVIGTARKP